MTSGNSSPEEELTRRERLQRQRLKRASSVVGGSTPSNGQVSTVLPDDTFSKPTTKNNMTRSSEKSPRYGDVPAYNLEDLTEDLLENELFDALDITGKEQTAAIALMSKNNLTLTDLAKREKNVSQTTLSRVKGAIETSSSRPTTRQLTILKHARRNPRQSIAKIANQCGISTSNVKAILRRYRNHEIELEKQETGADNDSSEMTDEDDSDENETEQTQSSTGSKYKYDPKRKDRRQTRAGQSLSGIKDKKHLISLFREMDQRLRHVEDQGVDVDVPTEFKGRMSALESRIDSVDSKADRTKGKMKGVEKVSNRIQNNQATLERVVEERLNGDSNEDSELDQRVNRIEQAIENGEIDNSNDAEFDMSDDERRRLIVALANNGEEELIGKFL